LTFKPFVYAVNVSIENLLDAKRIQAEFSSKLNKPVCIVCARFESEMMEYSPEEKNEFIKSY
jgi:ribosome-binding ATPase YchF (GTP1/OBG family)